ncbi:MAG TPA: septation ring formation regulator EzrA [Bacilli bacterium]|nr:septation ring formation regulator EzrA [Bacilli bacterium]
MDEVTLLGITLTGIAMVSVIVVLYVIRAIKNKNFKKELQDLDIEKNKIDSTPIVPELAKIESYLENEKLSIMYNEWKNRLEDIKEVQIPRITDMLLEADYTLSQMDYKSTLCKLAKLEMEIYKVRTNAEFLLSEIQEVTTSEERNRANITRLKTEYRELYQKFIDTKTDFGSIVDPVKLQFENIAKRFEDFERIIDDNQIQELNKLVNSIEEMLKHMTIVLDEMPTIVLMGNNILPSKIKEVQNAYDVLVREGYPLDYLNVEYNIEEANKKISDIMDRAKILNMEDSVLELKVLLGYFDGLFNDFEKEKVDRKVYEETNKAFSKKIGSINKLVDDIFKQLEEIINVYNLNEQDITLLHKIKDELEKLNSDYKLLMDHTGNNAFAFSKLLKEIELLVVRLSAIEESLDSTLDTIGSMKDDEVRARQQLDEVKEILKQAKAKIREFNFPVIPKSYFVELQEAQSAIKDIVLELDKKPITISVLNTRVDTARDLGLKLLSKTKEIVKCAKFAEMAIVYGNRYRSSVEELDKNLAYSEIMFFKGEYQKSLELSINCLNRVEPGIYDKLLTYYSK